MRKTLYCLASAFFISSACVFAAEKQIDPLKSIAYPHGMADKINVRDGFAYISSGWSRGYGLFVLDVSNPSKPKYNDFGIPVFGYPTTPVFHGDIIYQPTRFSLTVIDNSSNGKPEYVRNILFDFPMTAPAMSVTIAGNSLFLGSREYVRVFDILDPKSPVLKRIESKIDPNDILVTQGNTVYTANGKAVKGFSVGQDSIEPLFSFETEEPVRQMAPSGKFLILRLSSGKILSYEISSDGKAVFKTSIPSVSTLTGSDRKIFIQTAKNKIAILDPEALAELKILREFILPVNFSYGSYDYDGKNFFVIEKRTLTIYDASKPELTVSSVVPMIGEGFITASDNAIYMTGECSGELALAVFNIKNPAKDAPYDHVQKIATPKGEKMFGFYNQVTSLHVVEHGDHLIAGGALFSLKDPLKPEYVRHAFSPATDVRIIDGKAYMAQGDKFSIYDVSKLPESSLLGAYKPDSKDSLIFRLETDGRTAYIINRSKIEILDVRNPAEIKQLSAFDAPNPCGIVMNGKYLYVISGSPAPVRKFEIWDVSNPGSPKFAKEVGGLVVNGVSTVHADGKNLFAGDGNTIRQLDISEPLNPKLKAVYATAPKKDPDTSMTYTSIFTSGGMLYAKKYPRIDIWEIVK